MNMSDKTMGQMMERILGGEIADEHGFPWIASIRILGYHKCGGSILNSYWILTAAHCLINHEPETITIVIGTNNLMNGGHAYRADDIHTHSNYSKELRLNDIGLVKVCKKINFTNFIKPVKLPIHDINENNLISIFTGWGTTVLNGFNSNDLQVIELNVIKLNNCKTIFPKVGPGHICTLASSGQGICFGDSGSPLVSNGVQIGIAAWGSQTCAHGYPDIHSNVYYYLNWIKNITKLNNKKQLVIPKF